MVVSHRVRGRVPTKSIFGLNGRKTSMEAAEGAPADAFYVVESNERGRRRAIETWMCPVPAALWRRGICSVTHLGRLPSRHQRVTANPQIVAASAAPGPQKSRPRACCTSEGGTSTPFMGSEAWHVHRRLGSVATRKAWREVPEQNTKDHLLFGGGCAPHSINSV